ncbi:hypothetical protein E2C01_082319 [Portunus trituberculatus]|uniref:Secreted protein n=1 Tax=Portunus trituberculatus TaxID=210409 RepID=A0A5B7J1B0_PORTR|nr:hypothetical protein [Portunus trituberculatus]
MMKVVLVVVVVLVVGVGGGVEGGVSPPPLRPSLHLSPLSVLPSLSSPAVIKAPGIRFQASHNGLFSLWAAEKVPATHCLPTHQ